MSVSSGIIVGLTLNVDIISKNVGWKENLKDEYEGTM